MSIRQQILISAIAAVLLSIVLPRHAVSQEPATGIVEGIVVNAVDGKPVPGIPVIMKAYFWRDRDSGGTLTEAIQNQHSLPRQQGPAPSPVVTDNEGRFVFRNVGPNPYRIVISTDGYAPYFYGQRVTGGQGALLYLAAGETRRGLVLSITPTGVVTGTVTRRGGGPVEAAAVSLLQSVYHANGSRSMDTIATAQTNDRGEYRLYWAPPGRYFVRVVSSGAIVRSGFNGRPRPTLRETLDSDAYYPGVADIQAATTIQVAAGQERRNTNVVLDPVPDSVKQQTYAVRGRIVDSRTLQPPRRPGLELSRREPASPLNYQGPPYDSTSGRFTINGLSAGKYVLRATAAAFWSGVSSTNEYSLVPDLDGQAQAEIEIKDSDVTGVLMVLGNPTASLSGKVSVEGNGPGPERLGVRLWPSVDGKIAEGRGITGAGTPQPDGTLTIANPQFGEHWLLISDLPLNVYLKSARIGQIDLLTSPLRFPNPTAETINIVVSANAGSLQGLLQDTRRQPMPGLRAILIPNQRNRTDLFRTAISDYNGRFTIDGVVPGDYKLFSWEDIPTYAFFDSAFVSRFEQGGVAVRVAESSSSNVEVVVLPAATP